jgi:hypothetical protein
VGGRQKFEKQKKKKLGMMRGGEKIKLQKTKLRLRGKKNWEEGGEKIKLQKTMRSGLRKGKQQKLTWDGTGMEKRILSVHHPSTLLHWWVRVRSG